MKMKFILIVTVLFILLFGFLFAMFTSIKSSGSAEDASESSEYNLSEMRWDEIVEKGIEEGSVNFTTWWGDAFF